MMKEYIFICDKQWNIKKVFHDPQNVYIKEGTRIEDIILESSKIKNCVNQKAYIRNVHLKEDHLEMLALIHGYEKGNVLFLVHIEDQDDFAEFSAMYLDVLKWAEENLKALYKDEYYEIQKMNNQLLDSQRALVKNNIQLKKVLNEIFEANNLIAILEQDTLTSLYCATAFYQKAEARMKENKDEAFDIIVADIERFQMINEVFGRNAGDRLLKDFARFLIGIKDFEEGIFCRAYADTFYICMPSQEKFYQRLESEIKEYFKKYPLPVHISVKVGVYPVKDHTISVAQMCDRAFLAMEDTSAKGSKKIGFYNKELHERLIMEHKIIDSVPNALKNHEFMMYLQPKFEMQTDKIVGAEALIRWKHAEFGWVRPDQFIPLLEKRHQIYEIDKYIWEEACKALRYRKQKNLPQIPISVNVSRDDLYEEDLLEVLDHLIKKYELRPEQLHLEIIERAYVSDSDHMYEILKELREHGFVIEMDDFGTGESSLYMLADMPIDYIKLDRQFVVSGLHNERHIEVIRFIIHLAQTLKIDVLAEGVETKEHEKILYELGCRYAQGYYYAKPSPEIDFE